MHELRRSDRLYTAYKSRVQANQALLTAEGRGCPRTFGGCRRAAICGR